MAFIPVPNGIQLCFNFTMSGQNMQFCLTLRKTAGAPTVPDLLSMANTGASWWTATLKTRLSPAVTLNNVSATDLTIQGGPQQSVNVGTPGTSGTVPEANSICVVASLRTPLRGRSYRGRCYVPGIPSESRSTPTDVQSAFATNLAAAFGTLGGNTAALGFPVVVASRQHNGVVTNPATTQDVTSYVVDVHMDNQRRRLFGRGT